MKNYMSKRSILSVLLTLTMVLSIMPMAAFAANGTLSGAGTADAPYLIEDAADLETFRNMVNAAASSPACARLTADIDLNNQAWTPFSPSGYATDAYAGTFDGDFHTISGLSINTTASNQGLFGIINGATIKNLSVEGSVSSTNNYVGGIVGKIQQGTIENCSFKGSVTTTKSGGYAGGISGCAGNSVTQTAIITGCVNQAAVAGNTKGTVGGIVGYAKYTTINNCYNTGDISGATRSGGIAGQLQNNCSASNCYSIGTVSGSSSAADICDFLQSSATLENCYYPTKAYGAGTGTVSACEQINTADGLAAKLGSAFIADDNNINNGYPILSWQQNKAPVPKDPHIEISGGAKLSMTNNGTVPQTTLTVNYVDMDDILAVTWSVKDNSDAIRLEKPENAGESNNTVIVYAEKPGTATVVAQTADSSYTAECEISVMPFITTVEIDGTAATGETVFAKVYILGGNEYDYDNYPALKLQWKYLTSSDYSAGNTGSSSYKTIDGATNRVFTIPENLAGCYLSFTLALDGEDKVPSSPIRILSTAEGILSADKMALMLDTSDIRADKTLTLPQQGIKGSAITWASSDPTVIHPQTGVVTLPADGAALVTLTATLSYGESSTTKSFTIKVYSQKALDEEHANKQLQLERAVAGLGDYYKMVPVCGTDTNVLDMFKADLTKAHHENLSSDLEDIAVSIKTIQEVYGGAGIAQDGTITYFYTNPNTTPTVKMGSYQVTFTLVLEDASLDYQVPVIVYWDTAKVKAVMKQEISDKVVVETAPPLTENLFLPKVVDSKKWTQISWSSSNENAISISTENQQTADTLFNPFVGVVKRGLTDQQVTLTATFTFMLTNDVTGTEAPITLHKTFDVTVKALDEADAEEIKGQLEEKLNAGFEAAGLTDVVTGQLLVEENGKYIASNDIQFPTTRDFGVDGKYYPVTITSSNPAVIQTPDVNNAARAVVLRPVPGQNDAEATVTISISDKNTAVTAAKTFAITVPALTQTEIDSEKTLMAKVKASYFDGIKGGNTDAGNVSRDLSPFMEAYEKDGQLVWVRDSKDAVNHGIVPVSMDGWEELEAWRLFKSSNPAAITHENLLVSIQKNAKAVTVSSALSSETLGKYGALYQADPVTYAAYADMEALYYQEVSADLVVRGTTTKANARPVAVAETIDVSFRLQSADSTLIPDTDYTNLDETTTVFDIFKRALKENGYTYQNRGSYVYAITSPDGTTLEEMDQGENSGWMYKVNGKIPDVYMGGCGLKDGDEIVVFYTKDYTQENGYTYHGSSASGIPQKTEDKNTETPAKEDNHASTGNTPAYGDVSGHWAENAIQYVSKLGLMKGVADDAFAPEDSLTRAMFVTVVYRLEKEPETGFSPFSDVEAGSWYEKAVAWASQNNIVNGISDTEFAPDQNITREQMAAIVYRYAGFKGYDLTAVDSIAADTVNYTDRDEIADYAAAPVMWASAKSIMNGNPDGTFEPKGNSTRAQAAAVFMRIIENLQ